MKLLLLGLVPPSSRCASGGFAPLFGRHLLGPGLATAQPAATAKLDGRWVLAIVRVARRRLSRGLIDNSPGQLVYVGRALTRPLRHLRPSVPPHYRAERRAPDLYKQTDPLPRSIASSVRNSAAAVGRVAVQIGAFEGVRDPVTAARAGDPAPQPRRAPVRAVEVVIPDFHRYPGW